MYMPKMNEQLNVSRKTRIDWSNFEKLRNDKNIIVAAVCNVCQTMVRTITEKRLQNHRNSCKGSPAENSHDELIEEEIIEQQNTSENRYECTRHQDGYNEKVLPEDMKNKHEETMKCTVDKKLAMFFLTCSVPFEVVENKYFLDLVDTLCNLEFNYKPPSKKFLASNILDQVHKDIEKEKKQLLKNTDSVLLVDAWSNESINRKFLVCTLRNIHVPQTFLTFADTPLESEDLTENIEKAIEIAKSKYDTNIYAIVTDNGKIICEDGLVEASSDNTLLESTCSYHSGNSLIKSFVDDDFRKKLRDIVNAFHDPKLNSILQGLGETKLKNFSDTHVCNLWDTCESILRNLSLLQRICLIEDVIADNIANDIFSNDFRNRITDIVRNFTPICKLIKKCQDPSCNIADATEYWLSLKLPNIKSNKVIQLAIKKTIQPVGYAANYLHHKYKGNVLNIEHTGIANKYFQEHFDRQTMEEFLTFTAERDKFDTFAKNCVSPIAFWTLCSFKLPNLAKVAIKLMLIPASTALMEGFFSNWPYVHNVYGNRLTNEKSSQLINIYHSLKFINLREDIPKTIIENSKRKRLED